MQKLSDKIRSLRKNKGLSQTELAEKLGLKYQSVQKWENGKGKPTVTQLIQLSAVFEVSINDLMDVAANDEAESNKVEPPSENMTVPVEEVIRLQKKISELQDQLIKYQAKELEEKSRQIENQKTLRPD